MKPTLFLFFLVAAAMPCFAQTTPATEQKRSTMKTNSAVINPAVQQSSAVKTSGNNTTPINQSSNTRVDSAKASLLNVSFSVRTAPSYILDSATNKAGDTHWSCILYDQNNYEVASFYDNSNSDEYISGSVTPFLKMQPERSTSFGDFSKGGRLHISITPGGNDTWEIGEFDLILEFTSPNFTNKLKWNNVRLTQDNKDTDLPFNQQGSQGFKYDVKANKKS